MAIQLDIRGCGEWGVFPGEGRPFVVAGPCSAESEEQVWETAKGLKAVGVGVFRVGLWKPRTRPNCFEGVGEVGLPWMRRVREELGMRVGTEVAHACHVEACLKAGMDFLWVGARTTANPFAVQEIAEALEGVDDVPVLVKNPVNPDIELWVGALERLSLAGVRRLGAIHRGFSAYESGKYRNQPGWQVMIELKRRLRSLPVFCDPSHIGGRREYVREIAQKGLDLGCEGLFVESHVCPDEALSDGAQQLTPGDFAKVMAQLVVRSGQVGDGDLCMEAWREKIDELDRQLMDALAQRMRVCEEIGRYKKAHHLAALQADRWGKVLARALEEAREKGLPSELVERVFEAIHQASVDRQAEIMEDGK